MTTADPLSLVVKPGATEAYTWQLYGQWPALAAPVGYVRDHDSDGKMGKKRMRSLGSAVDLKSIARVYFHIICNEDEVTAKASLNGTDTIQRDFESKTDLLGTTKMTQLNCFPARYGLVHFTVFGA
ncbi:hypothetical protein PoB_004181500 [Plakobranchus ocellatus]|uniref:Uncharacterized protein n=1 Tax=Plakobranchus ocellatus TaxID=259542 RepID=A0AAV4B3W7_9GAST|nr:hypothetical protein PoB_004181500 [Plakobranchus ocellatus]